MREWRNKNREKINKQRRKWRKANPEKQRIYNKRYYYRHREKILERSKNYFKKHPEYMQRVNERKKERLRTDPEYREKINNYLREYHKKHPRNKIQPFTTGLKCGHCDKGIKTCTYGRLGKNKEIKCPHCGNIAFRHELEKIRIPRDIPKV